MIREKGLYALADCNFFGRWLASAGVEEPGVRDVSNVLRDLCEVDCPAL